MINEEMTGFVLPSGSTFYVRKYKSKPMGGFARTSPSYETSYTVDDTVGKMDGRGYTSHAYSVTMTVLRLGIDIRNRVWQRYCGGND